MNNWNDRFMDLAYNISTWSKDRSTKVGCVLVDPSTRVVLSMGYNGFPRGCDDDDDAHHERPAKYAWTEHAERNAIYNAALNGVKLDGCVAYLYFPMGDCPVPTVPVGWRSAGSRKLWQLVQRTTNDGQRTFVRRKRS